MVVCLFYKQMRWKNKSARGGVENGFGADEHARNSTQSSITVVCKSSSPFYSPPPNICSRILLVRMIQKLTRSWEILWKKQHLFRLLFFIFSFVEFLSANHSDDLVSGFSSESTGAQHKFSRSRLFSGAVRWCSGMGWVHNSLLIGATATVWAPWFHLSCFSCGRSRSFTVINSITCRKIQIWPPHFGNSKTPISKISRVWCICQTTFPSDNLLKLCTSFWLFILNQQNWVSESSLCKENNKKWWIDWLCEVVQEVAAFLENGKKARRLNSHVFSLLRAQSPHMDKLASMIKQNGTVLQHFKLPVTPSLLTRLALRGKSHNKKTCQYFSCASYTKNTHVPKIPKISSFNSFWYLGKLNGVMGSSFV